MSQCWKNRQTEERLYFRVTFFDFIKKQNFKLDLSQFNVFNYIVSLRKSLFLKN